MSTTTRFQKQEPKKCNELPTAKKLTEVTSAHNIHPVTVEPTSQALFQNHEAKQSIPRCTYISETSIAGLEGETRFLEFPVKHKRQVLLLI